MNILISVWICYNGYLKIASAQRGTNRKWLYCRCKLLKHLPNNYRQGLHAAESGLNFYYLLRGRLPKIAPGGLSRDKFVFTDFNNGALNMPTDYLLTNLTLTKSAASTTQSLCLPWKGLYHGCLKSCGKQRFLFVLLYFACWQLFMILQRKVCICGNERPYHSIQYYLQKFCSN